jgi:Mn2+/Fe2+ NRAMP family transporter
MKWSSIIIPGLLVAATGVGAGDLITAGLAGKYIGMGLILVPLSGALLKWGLNLGLVRYQLANQRTLLQGWFQDIGAWIKYPFALYLFAWSLMVGGALITACAVAGEAIYSLGHHGKFIWGIIHTLLGYLFVKSGRFNIFERMMTYLIGLMFVSVIYSAIVIVFNTENIEFNFNLTGNMGWLIGVMGGVGGTLTMLSYGYWIQETNRRGLEGLLVCKIDLMVSYLVTALFSVCMIIIGSQLSGVDISKSNFSLVIANQLELTVGIYARYIFLFGFWGGVFSSLIGVWQSVPYLFADFYYLAHNKKPVNLRQTAPYKNYALLLATLPIIGLWIKFESIQLAYAVMGALFMPLLAISLLYLNNKKVSIHFKSSRFENGLLVVTSLFFIYIGISELFF